MTRRNTPRVSFIGFGEAGQAIASGLREAGIERIAAWDILFPVAEGARLKAAGESMGVRLANSAADAVRDTDMIISAVTAASSLEAARSVEPHLSGAPYYLDINSVSPGRKQETAKLLGERARYVDVAVIAPIHPARHKTPLLISGPHAEAIAPLLGELEMKLRVVSAETGQAAAIKMIRSVMIKGIEALTAECFLAASRAGVLEDVTASLKNNYPSLDWSKIAEYNLERMASHGERRAAEMEESAATLRELGLDPLMVESTVKRQREMGALGKDDKVRASLTSGRAAMLDAINARPRTSAERRRPSLADHISPPRLERNSAFAGFQFRRRRNFSRRKPCIHPDSPWQSPRRRRCLRRRPARNRSMAPIAAAMSAKRRRRPRISCAFPSTFSSPARTSASGGRCSTCAARVSPAPSSPRGRSTTAASCISTSDYVVLGFAVHGAYDGTIGAHGGTFTGTQSWQWPDGRRGSRTCVAALVPAPRATHPAAPQQQ